MIKNSNKISVLMSAYNSEKTIANSINSILNQSYTNFELLIVNDASTDSTIEICKNFENLDNRQLNPNSSAFFRYFGLSSKHKTFAPPACRAAATDRPERPRPKMT